MTTQTITKWALDAAHSEIGFKAKHLMITTVSGKFEKYNSTVEMDGDDLTKAKITFTADTASINTTSPDRDTHLKSADFFDADNFPQLKFVSTKVEQAKDNKYLVYGDLTIRSITKPVKLEVESVGIVKDPYGNSKAGFIIDGKINRKDWNLNWNVALEAGGVLVSEEIKIHCEVQLAKQAS